MADISLRWTPTSALLEWAEAQWYYLPESVDENATIAWTKTMREIICELDSRGISLKLQVVHSDDNNNSPYEAEMAQAKEEAEKYYPTLADIFREQMLNGG